MINKVIHVCYRKFGKSRKQKNKPPQMSIPKDTHYYICLLVVLLCFWIIVILLYAIALLPSFISLYTELIQQDSELVEGRN